MSDALELACKHYNRAIDLEEIIGQFCMDAEAEQPAPQQTVCKNCHGDGVDGEADDGINGACTWACEYCNGTGYVDEGDHDRGESLTGCERCNATGQAQPVAQQETIRMADTMLERLANGKFPPRTTEFFTEAYKGYKKNAQDKLAQPVAQPVAYLAWKDGKPCYEGDDAVCEDAVWPVDSDDDRTSMPVYLHTNIQNLDTSQERVHILEKCNQMLLEAVHAYKMWFATWEIIVPKDAREEFPK